MATIFAINVELDEKQMETAVQHFGEARMDNFVADMQGTVRSFLDSWTKEDEEVKARKTTTTMVTPTKDEKLFNLLAILRNVEGIKKRNEICSKIAKVPLQTANLAVLTGTFISYDDMFEIIKILGKK